MIEIENLNVRQEIAVRRFFLKYNDAFLNTFIDVKNKNMDADMKNVSDEASNSYYMIVNRTRDLLAQLEANDPFYVCAIFQYVLWNGYFSKDKRLVYDFDRRVNATTLFGADIMRGYSVCLNNSIMLRDVLNFMGIESYYMGVNLKDNLDLIYKPSIFRAFSEEERNKGFLNKIREAIFNRVTNHAIVMFKYNEYYFGSDPTNLAFLNFVDFLKMQYVGGETTVKVSPLHMLLLNQIENEEFYKIILEPFILSDEARLDLEKIKCIYEASTYKCEENLSLLNDFYLENVCDIDVICKNLRR